MKILNYLLITFFIEKCAFHRTVLQNNGYKDIVVAISPAIYVNDPTTFVQNIMQMFDNASSVLYEATRKRAFFEEIRILIPQDWILNMEVGNSTWETYSDADVRISQSNPAYRDTPYTLQTKGCGQSGEYIHLSPNYVEYQGLYNTERYGPAGRVLVHEWAHLRYGVFDEYGIPGDPLFPLFYRIGGHTLVGNRNQIIPNLCSDKEIKFTIQSINGFCGYDVINGDWQLNENCGFSLNDDFQPITSLLSDHAIDSVTTFCDDDNHNFEAPNLQNRICGRQSIWSVISQHEDFADNKNPSTDISNIKPRFIVIQPRRDSNAFVLVLDVSGSMELNQRISNLNQATRRWINYEFPSGEVLGIVIFSDEASLKGALRRVDDDMDRNYLMNAVPNTTYSSTCIGCGLEIAINELQKQEGGTIILLSDGKNNIGNNTEDYIPDLIKNNIQVVTLAFGTEADTHLEYLAQKTNGACYYITDENAINDLNNALNGALSYRTQASHDNNNIITILQEEHDDVYGIMGNFSVDFTIGIKLTLTFIYGQGSALQTGSLTSPSGIVYSDFVPKMNGGSILIPVAQVGLWNFRLEFNQRNPVLISVKSESSHSMGPIWTRCWIGNGLAIENAAETPIVVLAEVRQRYNAVIGATVWAYITAENSQTEIVRLVDDGIDPDLMANDGTYSGYFFPAWIGRYSVTCRISDGGNAYISQGSFSSGILIHDGSPYCCGSQMPNGSAIPTGRFTRFYSAGSFRVNQTATSDNQYPPRPIYDLTANADGIFITLNWTAPNGQLNKEIIVSDYILKYSARGADLSEKDFYRNSSGVYIVQPEDIAEGSMDPVPPGQNQQVTLMLKNLKSKTNYFFALKTINYAGKLSPVSNIASVYITYAPDYYTGMVVGILAGIFVSLAFIFLGGFYFFRMRKAKPVQKMNITLVIESGSEIQQDRNGVSEFSA